MKTYGNDASVVKMHSVNETLLPTGLTHWTGTQTCDCHNLALLGPDVAALTYSRIRYILPEMEQGEMSCLQLEARLPCLAVYAPCTVNTAVIPPPPPRDGSISHLSVPLCPPSLHYSALVLLDSCCLDEVRAPPAAISRAQPRLVTISD